MYCTIWSQINVIYYSLIIFFSSGLLNTVTGSLSQWMTVLVNRINECKMSELERSWKIRHHYFLMNFHEHANVYLWIKTHTNCCVSSLTFRILGRSTFLCTFFKIFLWFFFFYHCQDWHSESSFTWKRVGRKFLKNSYSTCGGVNNYTMFIFG